MHDRNILHRSLSQPGFTEFGGGVRVGVGVGGWGSLGKPVRVYTFFIKGTQQVGRMYTHLLSKR